jgi:hypothetical protein
MINSKKTRDLACLSRALLPRNRSAQMEMSIGTIVTVILGVTLLVGGIFFVQQIMKSATGVVDLTDQQLRDQINKLFSEESKISIYPGTRFVEIKQEKTDEVGIGIKNLLTGNSGDVRFSYDVIATDVEDCGVSKEEAEEWIVTGQSEKDIPIASGDFFIDRIRFRIPLGAPLCIAKYRINVKAGNDAYTTDSFEIEIKAK